jgi:hydroxyisourate hydrolase
MRQVSGLTTHVLDLTRGRPAAGVGVTLLHGSEPVVRTVTDAGGRASLGPLEAGTYELRFAVGAYFAAGGDAVGDPPFLDVVPVRFGVSDPEQPHHVPLLVSPWAYSTYRGS